MLFSEEEVFRSHRSNILNRVCRDFLIIHFREENVPVKSIIDEFPSITTKSQVSKILKRKKSDYLKSKETNFLSGLFSRKNMTLAVAMHEMYSDKYCVDWEVCDKYYPLISGTWGFKNFDIKYPG